MAVTKCARGIYVAGQEIHVYTLVGVYHVHVGGGELHDSQSFANGSAEVQVLESSALGQQLLLQLRAKPPLMRSCS